MSETLHPRLNTKLFGFGRAEDEFRDALGAGRMHHAWLITGPRGSGKATFAYHVARAILAADWEVGEEHLVFRRVAAGSHADLLVLEPPFDPDKEEVKREIPVEQAREAVEFLSLTPAEGDFRVVIVDSADELNIASANALLKALEEPPPRALILLVSHNPGRLLPTVRSRCRALRAPAPNAVTFAQAMEALTSRLSEKDIAALGVLSAYSPGTALALAAQGGLELYEELTKIIGQGEAQLSAFAESFGGGQHARWQALGLLFTRLIARAIDPDFKPLFPAEEAARKALTARLAPAALAAAYATVEEQFSVAARSHLDYKTVIITLLHSHKLAA